MKENSLLSDVFATSLSMLMVSNSLCIFISWLSTGRTISLMSIFDIFGLSLSKYIGDDMLGESPDSLDIFLELIVFDNFFLLAQHVH